MSNELNRDWHDSGLEELMNEICEDTGLDITQVIAVYGWLVNDGFIDYDTEKEIIWARQNPDE